MTPREVPQEARTVECKTQRAEPHRRILFRRRAQIGDHLVAADIEQAEYDRLAFAEPDGFAIKRDLLLHLGQAARDHELQLRPEQPDALRPRVCKHRQVGDQSGIVEQRDRDSRPER